jgi:UDP-2,4-diacetamido-2,4,6-trideoxy-beta-L-altropyranose hydrolase
MNSVAKVVIRLDASVRGGLGHLRRCAVLGRHLRLAGIEVFFLVRTADIDVEHEVAGIATTFSLMSPELSGVDDARTTVEYCRAIGADRLIVDHFSADDPYQRVLLAGGIPWLQFDGDSGTPLWADWVLSMVPGVQAEPFHARARRAGIRWLLGTRYAILRDEFSASRPSRMIPAHAQRILLTFGGGDDYGATLLCLQALKQIGWSGQVDIVLGGRSPARNAIEEWARGGITGTVHLHIDASNMADLIAGVDLVISAGGTTSFETAALGVSALLIRTVPNQWPNTRGWQALGAAIDLGDIVELTSVAVGARIKALSCDQPRRIAMSDAGRKAVDCRGAERIVEALCNDVIRDAK